MRPAPAPAPPQPLVAPLPPDPVVELDAAPETRPLDPVPGNPAPQPESPPPPFLPADQWELLQAFNRELDSVRMEECVRCRERWFGMDLRSDGVCHRCSLRDKSTQTPFLMSADNDMDPGDVPTHLPELTQLEEMVIARCHVQMLIKRYRGHQYHYSGHCVSFMQNTVKTVSVLPSLPQELDIVLLRPSKGVADDPRFRRQFQRDFRVRRLRVLTWLRYLKRNHPDYRDVQISDARLQELPEDGDVSASVMSMVDVTLTADTQPPVPESPEDLPPPNTQATVPDTHATTTELEQMLNEIAGLREAAPDYIPAPSIRSTPIDEAAGKDRIFAMAFPTLYPTGRAEFNSPRQRTVTLKEYARHLLCYRDGRFGRHPRWRFLLFNMLMRRKAGGAARYFASKSAGLRDLDCAELGEAFRTDKSILPQIVRQGTVLNGTRPFWSNKGNHLQAQARFLTPGIGPVFLTFSCADMQWDDLQRHFPRYEEYHTGSESVRRRIVWQNVQDHPHIVAAYLELRLRAFLRLVLRPWLGYSDYWMRFEWQARGSGHIHALFWIEGAPALDPSTPFSRAAFAKYWGERITAWNPAQTRRPDARNPASLPRDAIANSADQFAALLNRLQIHSECRASYCLRKKKGSDVESCRFFFPRPLFAEATVTQQINHKSWLFSPARNQATLNQCSPINAFGWLANTDAQPPTDYHALLEYIGKYVSKPETKSMAYTELQALVLPHVNHYSPLMSFASRMLNKLIAERDWSAQEVSHILLDLPLQEASRVLTYLDCRPPELQKDGFVIEDGSVKATASPLARYQARMEGRNDRVLRDLSLFEWLRAYNFTTRVPRPRAPLRVISYWPRYSKHPDSTAYPDYCRVRLMLHHPFTSTSDLLSFDGRQFDSYAEAFAACRAAHSHPADYYDDPDVPEDSDSDEEPDVEPEEDQIADFEAFARRRPGDDLTTDVPMGDLGMRDLDRAYDWSPYVGKYAIDPSIWLQVKDANPIQQEVTATASPRSPNDEQRKLYDVVIQQYLDELDDRPVRQLLLNIDGVAGSGKTYILLAICLRLQTLAAQAGKENPVFRAAPTGIAAFNIVGRTLHSLLRLPVKSTKVDMSTSTLYSLQALFKSCRFLIIDEKSMIDIRTLSLIDDRLRAIFPAHSDQMFGGLNILLCGDFFQLPPVGGRPLYTVSNQHVDAIKGHSLYGAFDRTVRLTQVMRQQGQDDVSRMFRTALDQLRNSNLSTKSWQLLCARVANRLSAEEVARFDTALRLYFTNEEVRSRNYDSLAARNAPVKKVLAQNTGRNASKATDEEADNLYPEICVCIGARVMLTSNLWTEVGLVNGSLGTVEDISWQLSRDPSTDMPFVILVRFDGYKGPSFPGCGQLVPVFAVTRKFDYKSVPCSRTQFPLRLAYAITVHKSQGLTLSRAVLNINQREHCLGLTYVAVSRVKRLKDLMFECPFDFERFQHIDSMVSKDRDVDIVYRSRQVI